MSSLSLSEAELIGVILQSGLFGLYVALSSGCLYVLFRRLGASGSGPLNKTLVVITVILFVLITSHWVVCITRVFRAFKQDGGPDAYLEYAGNPLYVVKTALYVAQTFVGDVTMVYRLYIVWSRSWRIIVAPVITTTALLISGLTVIYMFATISQGTDIFTSAVSNWIIVVFVTSLATNLVVTSLITFRIWSINRRVRGPLRSNLMPVATMVIESAALYTVFLMITEGLYLAKANLQFTTLDMTSPIIGIAFSLLIIRVGLGHKITTDSLSARNQHYARRGVHGSSGFSSVQAPIEVSVLTHVDHMYATSASVDEGITAKPIM